MKNSMGHFVGWTFGVPVKVRAKLQDDQEAVSGETRLIHEDEHYFDILTENGAQASCSKNYFYYELIPYKYPGFSPRFPVCQNKNETAFCNSTYNMTCIGVTLLTMKPYSYPVATLNIDGKTIELSAETVANLKKELGI